VGYVQAQSAVQQLQTKMSNSFVEYVICLVIIWCLADLIWHRWIPDNVSICEFRLLAEILALAYSYLQRFVIFLLRECSSLLLAWAIQ
jgi:hypothetical protein